MSSPRHINDDEVFMSIARGLFCSGGDLNEATQQRLKTASHN